MVGHVHGGVDTVNQGVNCLVLVWEVIGGQEGSHILLLVSLGLKKGWWGESSMSKYLYPHIHGYFGVTVANNYLIYIIYFAGYLATANMLTFKITLVI